MAAEPISRTGPAVLSAFLDADECDVLLAAINDYRQHHPLPVVSRPHSERPLHYQVIDGHQFPDAIPDAGRLLARARQPFDPQIAPTWVILAGNLPALAVQPLLPALALRRPVLLKSPSAEPLFAPAFLEALTRREPRLAGAVAAAEK